MNSKPSAKSNGSTKKETTRPEYGNPEVAVTLLDYGTTLEPEFKIEENQKLSEDKLFILEDASTEEIEALVAEHVKTKLPEYNGKIKTVCNPEDIVRVMVLIHTLAMNNQLEEQLGEPTAGKLLRLIGHIYVILLEPLNGPEGCDGFKEQSTLVKPSTNKKPNCDYNCHLPPSKRLRLSMLSEKRHRLELTHEGQFDPPSRDMRDNFNKDQQQPEEVNTTNSKKRKRAFLEKGYQEPWQPMNIQETTFRLMTTMNRPRITKKAVRPTTKTSKEKK